MPRVAEDRPAGGGSLLPALVVAAPVLLGAGYALLGALGLAGPAAGGFSTARATRVLAEAAVWEGLAWTAGVALASTALATAAAVLVAVSFRRAGLLERLAHALAVVPLPVPHVVAGVGGLLVLGQAGILSRLGHAFGLVEGVEDMPPLVNDPWGLGLVLTLAWKEFPFLALVAFSLVAGRAGLLEETARSLGAGGWETFHRVTAPLLWRGLLPAVVAVFAFVVGSYEVAALLAPSDPLALPLLLMERYGDASLERRSDAFVIALLTFVLSAGAVALHEWVRARWGALER